MEKKNDRDIAESLAFIIQHMATKDDVREITEPHFKKIDERLEALESKVDGINRRLDTEAMQRTDLKMPRRVHDLEEEVYGPRQSKHPKHLPL